ncbi:Hypothetical protein A7982_09742 [Minicystis rosea]|nr:Hypothetical protein A7982_09742 [Minicystis rosea]
MRASRIAALAALLSCVSVPRPAGACATAPPPGLFVQIAEESALIVWDAREKREHFIRRASFHTVGKDFGFLVPTPDKPELAEVGDEVFDRLEQATKPEVVRDDSIRGVEPTLSLGLFLFSKSAPATASVAAAPVSVLAEQRVAGYDAVVLSADDPGALATWLKDHGYATRPELISWLAPYVKAHWKITAFKIAGGNGHVVGTSAVRMSFATERPFYPYREPADQREAQAANAPGARRLRVFFVGTERVDGDIGSATGTPGSAKRAWPGRAVWSDRLALAPNLGPLPVAVPEGAWLTMFEDTASPRPGTEDLFFAPAADRQAVKPPPVILRTGPTLPLPLDIIGGGALAVGLYLRRKRQRAEAKEA